MKSSTSFKSSAKPVISAAMGSVSALHSSVVSGSVSWRGFWVGRTPLSLANL